MIVHCRWWQRNDKAGMLRASTLVSQTFFKKKLSVWSTGHHLKANKKFQTLGKSIALNFWHWVVDKKKKGAK